MTAREAMPRAVHGHVLRLLLSALLAVAIFWFLATRVDVGSAWAGIRAMSWLELLTIAAVTGWNLVTYWALWVAATPGLRWSQAAVLAQAGTALTNTVPGGSALGVRLAYGMLDSWGFSRARSSQAVLVTGGWNLAVKLGLPIVALALLALQGDTGHGRLTAGLLALAVAAVAAVVGVMLLRSDRTARALGDAAARAASRVAYLHLSPAYDADAAEAAARGWPVRSIPGQHLDLATRPDMVAGEILALAGL